ncbi:MAG: flavin reductase [Erysipelotrichaceae bacterium]
MNNLTNEVDSKALYNIGYGLYVVTCNDTVKDNGLIVNTVTQLTSTPCVVAVTINKMNYSCEVIKQTKKLNISPLEQSAPFEVFKRFGFQSGKDVDKFAGFEDVDRSNNGLLYLTKYSNSLISCQVIDTIELSTHMMFICEVVQSARLTAVETMTYNYYQNNVKPKPQVKKNSYVCKVCGYVYEGENLPDDFVCPLCKHPASDFQLVQSEEKPKGYVCKVCGYIYEGENLPEDYICPICKHPASDFEPLK